MRSSIASSRTTCANALRPEGAKPRRANISIGIARESLLPEQLGLSIGLMQPTPGILLGQHFRQALLEKHADRQACTGSTFAGRCGKLGEQQFP
jgi:hypothetical protein